MEKDEPRKTIVSKPMDRFLKEKVEKLLWGIMVIDRINGGVLVFSAHFNSPSYSVAIFGDPDDLRN